MDVCVGDENPPAPAPAPAPASPAGSASTSALSAAVPPYSLPQEDQAQGSGYNADHPADVDLDCGHCSPHSSSRSSNQSLDVCDGDGARPLRQPADPAERPTPRTPTSSAGGARGEGGPEASDRSPTTSSPEYSANMMSSRLDSIPLEGRSVEDVEADVKKAFLEFGIEMKRFDSKQSSKEPGARLRLIGLACKHAMPNRQKEYRDSAGNVTKERKTWSARTGCEVKGYITWPVHGAAGKEHPVLNFTRLDHNHPVNKHAVDEVCRQTKPLDTATEEAYAGFKPAVQGKMIEALTGARPNPRAIQNHAATHGRKKKSPYDANELLERVKATTGDGGKYLLKMDNEGRMTHLFWMTASQAFFGDFLKMRGRLSESGFEESFKELVDKYPKAEEYLRHTLYKDRHRLAAAFSVLKFSISSFTSCRVEGINKIMKKVCGAMTSLQGVFEFFEGTLEAQEDRAKFRSARLALPAVELQDIGGWPLRFMTQEMDAAAIFCGGNKVLEGAERFSALGKLEFLGDFMAMRLTPKFKFHVGILNRHWLTENGLRELEAWPPECKPQWMVARNHAGASDENQVRAPTVAMVDTWQAIPAIPENATIECTLQRRDAQAGQSSQERRLLYVEMLKRTSAAVSSGVQLVPPDTLRAIVQTFESSLNAAARISSGEGAVVGNPQAVRQPAARSQGSRQRSSIESGGALLRGRAQGH
eukprot:jgi/Undpi1/13011/HiC_scaffold_7.g02675.m1